MWDLMCGLRACLLRRVTVSVPVPVQLVTLTALAAIGAGVHSLVKAAGRRIDSEPYSTIRISIGADLTMSMESVTIPVPSDGVPIATPA